MRHRDGRALAGPWPAAYETRVQRVIWRMHVVDRRL